VGAWLPLYLAVGVGACAVGQLVRHRAREVLIAAGAVATAWAVWANHADLGQRDYRLAEFYARSILDPVDANAVLLLSGDDANGLCSYLQRVAGERGDVALVTSSFLHNKAPGRPDWYDEILLQRHPFLKQPDYEGMKERFPQTEAGEVAIAAFINANADCGRPIFCIRRPAPELIRRDYQLIPAGVNWKLVSRSGDALPDSRYWRFPIEPEQVRSQYRRVRCQNVQYTPQGVVVKPEGNERRLLSMLLLSRFRLALAMTERGQFGQAARLCESVVALDEEFRENPEIVHLLAISLHASGEDGKAEPVLRRSAQISLRPQNRATATFYLGEIARKRGDETEALRYFREAVATPGIDDATRREIESRLKPR
jgi:tetratricopeptide (TPR) repeat protein